MAKSKPSFQGPVAHKWETWETIAQKTTALSNEISRRTLLNPSLQEHMEPITRIAVVPRGGLYIVNILARDLALDGSQVVSLGISKYDRDHPTKAGKFKIGQLPRKRDVKDQVVLIADEVHDTGETTEKAKEIIYDLGATTVYTVAVHTKPNKRIDGVPALDVFIEETDDWVHYPWEVIDEKGSIYAIALDAMIGAREE